MEKNQLKGRIDIAIITIIPEEYEAVHSRLINPTRDPGSSKKPNLYAWEIGYVNSTSSQSPYKVVLTLAGRPGNITSSQVISATINRWKPRYVILVGIAGGFNREGLSKGDVVLSEVIWAYEYGKIEKKFIPRHNFIYQVDTGLLTNAKRLAITDFEWRQNIGFSPESVAEPKVIPGEIASGDKVIDDISNEFFAEVLKAWPKIIAVEMEGGGAASAITQARDEGKTVGFFMVRGISDMPSNPEAVNTTKSQNDQSKQTLERDKWKKYASATAASFTIQLIAKGWPIPPFSKVKLDNKETAYSKNFIEQSPQQKPAIEFSLRDIFLSHHPSDRDFVNKLASDLESSVYEGRNLLTWVEGAEIRPGQSIPKMINQGLEKSRFIGLVMTPDYFQNEDGWLEAEWYSILGADPSNQRARIIPLLVKDCPYVPILLKHIKAIDFLGNKYKESFAQLLSVLRDEPLPRPAAKKRKF